MKKKFMLLTTLFCFQTYLIESKATSSKKMQNESLKDFHHEFAAWKKNIPSEQADIFHELFDEYEQNYQQYLKHPANKELQNMLETLQEGVRHIMNNWQPLFDHYSKVMAFHKKVQNWTNQLSNKKHAKIKPLLNTYENQFQKYDKDPLNPDTKKEINTTIEKIKIQMTK